MPAPVPNYVHRARLARQDEIPARATPVHDGDTFYLRIDLGTYAAARIDPVVRFRLLDIDTYELNDPSGKGVEARNFTENQLATRRVTVATEKPVTTSQGETVGRVLGAVWVDDDKLSDLLRAAGYEKPLV